MVTGWLQNQLGEYFYFDANGSMATNRWIQTNNRWYYLGDSGVMLVDQCNSQMVNGTTLILQE
ncbi:hypothetical protein HC352_00390 [Arcanobacterium buesumense]|uniref:Cell wall binding repeat-containing protein n=1 Tax=Arcanobacterium buesumense TaxID=2722751 RepID=A0A6H2ENH1_9ACTO|nr:hypothetical protein HC352_00390 [Arcanobacterium buesumense]